jgi:hypothetical protein
MQVISGVETAPQLAIVHDPFKVEENGSAQYL